MKKEPEHRINERITAPAVRVVCEGLETTIMDNRAALQLAYNRGLDLVEISPNSDPPVCKVVDYQKFLYEQKKKQKENKANTQKTVIKEIKISPQIDEHDFDFKLKHAIEFLKDGDKVKVSLFFAGRQIVYKDQGEATMLRFAEALLEYGKPEVMPRLDGKRMHMIIAPKKK